MELKDVISNFNEATEDIRALSALLLLEWANMQLENKDQESYQERLQKQMVKK